MRFSDGSKLTNLGQRPRTLDAEPLERVLLAAGGGGSDRMYTQEYWCWPLPPPGDLAFVFEWPHFEVDLREQVIDAAVILDAATTAAELWPDESKEDESGGKRSP
jgi:hypothetical protein